MRLNRLPRDALDNVLSHLCISDILALARVSDPMSTAVAPFLHNTQIHLNSQCKNHLFHPTSRIGHLVAKLSIHDPLSMREFQLLGNACPNLTVISFHNITKGVQSSHLCKLFRAIGPALLTFSAQFCAALTGPVLLPALSRHCPNLTDLHLHFAPHVYAEHLDQLFASVGHQLRTLKLDTCIGVDDAVVSVIAKRCLLLKYLCVGSSEDVGDEGVLALAKAPCGKSLRHLDIRGCMHVTDVGVYAIATSFTALIHLNIWRVCVTSYAIRAVAEGLGEKLETLIMGDCIGIDDTALFSIADNCDALMNLEMAGLKRVSDAGILSLFDSKKIGRARLETLTIDGCNSISEVGVLAAAGLWDGQWTRMIVDSETASSQLCWDSQSVEGICGDDQQDRRKEEDCCNHGECSSAPCRNESSSEGEATENSIDAAGEEVIAQFYQDCLTSDEDESEASTSTGGELAHTDRCDECSSLENLEGFEPATNVSYLQKLSATGTTELEPALFRHIRDTRPNLELRVDVAAAENPTDRITGQSNGLLREHSCSTPDWQVLHPCGQYFMDGWLEMRRTKSENSRKHSLVLRTRTVTGIDTQADSFAEYQDATVTEQVGLS